MISKLDLYRIFVKVAQSESFSDAAKQLFMTQPAVSQSIMQLERELDTRLFYRSPKGATLTSEGRLLFEYIQSAMSLIHTGEQKILEFKNLTIGELKIGVGDTISRYYLLRYLEKFHINYPNIKFKIMNATTMELCSALKSGSLDIAFCNLPLEDAALEQLPCYAIEDIFVVGQQYRYLLEQSQTMDMIIQLPLIFLESKSNSRKYVEEYMASCGVSLAPAFELGSHDLLLEFAKINLGVASVIKQFSLDYLDKQLVFEVPLVKPIPSRNIGICYLRNVPLSIAATRFVEMINGDNSSSHLS
ncbi:LysR family transcriptional regulator [Paenibacillus yanchengensis]|uniref:LysR family transcriptional regulator n=1 Tax=Paenibacillus yanchengensis TaxID=2035833 RepID=A0ABW4YPR5_9BACL